MNQTLMSPKLASLTLPTATEWWPYLQEARAILEAAGATFRRGEDIADEIEQIRGESDRADAVYWEMEWDKHHEGSPRC